MSWVCAQIFGFPLIFFFCNNKKGSVSPMDISDLALEKREGEFTTKKWGRVGRQSAFWAEKLSWTAFILFYFVHRSNSIFLELSETQKIEFELDFAQSLSALAASLDLTYFYMTLISKISICCIFINKTWPDFDNNTRFFILRTNYYSNFYPKGQSVRQI
jgi:hypothetical protein